MMALGDGRFAGHPLFRHVAVDLLNLNRNSTISHVFLKESFGDTHVTNEQLVAEVTKEKSKILDKLMIFAGEERGSKEFLYQRAIEMESLMYYKVYKGEGGPSAFITMSEAEFWDPFLHQLLKDYVKQTQGVDIDFSNPKVMVQCVSMYPHVIVHYFDYRVQSFMKLVLQKFHGVTDYYFRYEFSPGRGAIHLHGFIWIENALPGRLINACLKVGKTDEEMAQIIGDWLAVKFGMTAIIPNVEIEPELIPPQHHNIVDAPLRHIPSQLFPRDNRGHLTFPRDIGKAEEVKKLLQLNTKNLMLFISKHLCTPYCFRPLTAKQRKRLNKSADDNTPVCRMEFPMPRRAKPAVEKDKNGVLRLRFARVQDDVVPTSVDAALGLMSNHYFDFFWTKSDPPSSKELEIVKKYVMKYCFKEDKNELPLPLRQKQQLMEIAQNNEDGPATITVQKLLNKNTTGRCYSASEAMLFVEGVPYFHSTRSMVRVPAESKIKAIDFGDAEEAPVTSRKNIFDRYLTRPQQQEHFTFYQYVMGGHKHDQNGRLRGGKDKIPVFPSYLMWAKFPVTPSYCKYQILLHGEPFRQIPEVENWEEAFLQLLQTPRCPDIVKNDYEHAKERYEKANQPHQNINPQQNVYVQDEDEIDPWEVDPEIPDDDDLQFPREELDAHPFVDYVPLGDEHLLPEDAALIQQWDYGDESIDWSVSLQDYPNNGPTFLESRITDLNAAEIDTEFDR